MENRSGGWDSRPSNELFFIHDVESALFTVRYPQNDPNPKKAFDPVLLQACKGLVESLQARLEPHMEVRMLTDIFITWRDAERHGWREADVMVDWVIDDPERRQNEAETAELKAIKGTLGFDENLFEELWAECSQKKRTGPAPAGDTATISRKVAKRFREEHGLKEITARETDRVRYLIDKHQRGGRQGGPSAEIIPFGPRVESFD